MLKTLLLLTVVVLLGCSPGRKASDDLEKTVAQPQEAENVPAVLVEVAEPSEQGGSEVQVQNADSRPLPNRYIIERAIISDAFQDLDQKLKLHHYRFDMELDGELSPERESVYSETQGMIQRNGGFSSAEGGTWTDTFEDGTIRKTSCHIISSADDMIRLVESDIAGGKVDTQAMYVVFYFTSEIIRKGVRPKKEEERITVHLTIGRNETTFDSADIEVKRDGPAVVTLPTSQRVWSSKKRLPDASSFFHTHFDIWEPTDEYLRKLDEFEELDLSEMENLGSDL